MKKTSLMLAIGALLYGTSSYTRAVVSFDKIDAILSQLPVEDIVEPPEDGNSGADDPAGTDPFILPVNVTVDDSVPVHREHICNVSVQNAPKNNPSFQVDGEQMAKFPVTVFFGDGTSETVSWEAVPPNGSMKGVARGIIKEWFLAQKGDTWYRTNPWILHTATGVSIKKIVLEPINRYQRPVDQISYAFDIGGANRYKADPDPQHTPDSSNGRVIEIKKPPSPNVNFTAIYKNPVYVSGHTPDSPHDLYGILEINFTDADGIGGTTTIDVTDFAYIADTDCLPVEGVTIDSYQNGVVNFTLTGEGNAYIMQRCGTDDSSQVAGPFAVDYEDGGKEFSTTLTLQNGCYYSVENIADDGTLMGTVPLEGVSTNSNNEYYYE